MRLGAVVVALALVAGCGPSEEEDAGMDAAALDAGVDAGEACASHAECLASAREGFHDRVHCVAGLCVPSCGDSAQCAGHPRGPTCLSGACGCAADPDCGGFPRRCIAGACGECTEDADCVFGRAPLCERGACVRCRTDGDCETGRSCVGGSCVGPDDMDGDGFGADDCDDSDAEVYPGALPTCGDGVAQGCAGGDWSALATQLGAAEAGQHPLRRVFDGEAPDALVASVATASLAEETYVAFVHREPPGAGGTQPRRLRVFAVPFDAPVREIELALADLDCGQPAPVTVEEVDQVVLDPAADGSVHLAVGATVDGTMGTEHYLAHFTIAAGTPSLVRCELADDQTQFGYAAVGIAPESGTTGALLRGVTGSRDNVLQTFGAPTVTLFRCRDWLDGEGAVVVTRSRATAGSPITLHFGFEGSVIDEEVATVASTFDRGRAALAAAPGGDYAVVLPTNAATYLVEGRCAGASCGPAATATTWDLAVEDLPAAHWVGASRFALAFVRYVEPEPGLNEGQIRLRGFERGARPLTADPASDAPQVASRIALPGPGALTIRDLAVGAVDDRIDVAFVAQSNSGAPHVWLRRVRFCATE